MAMRIKRWWYSSRAARGAGVVMDAAFGVWMWVTRTQPRELGR